MPATHTITTTSVSLTLPVYTRINGREYEIGTVEVDLPELEVTVDEHDLNDPSDD